MKIGTSRQIMNPKTETTNNTAVSLSLTKTIFAVISSSHILERMMETAIEGYHSIALISSRIRYYLQTNKMF